MRNVLPLAVLVTVLALAAGWWLDDPDRRASLQSALDTLWSTPPPIPEPAPPGTPFEFELVGEPRAFYGPAPLHPSDHPFVDAVEAAGLTYSPALGHAARELATFYAEHGRLAPGETLAFLLDAAGAAYWGVRQAVVVTVGDARGPLLESLREQADDGGPWHAGVGEAVINGRPSRWVRALLVARPTLTLDPLERTAAEGDRVRITGQLRPGFREPTAEAMSPDGVIQSLDVSESEGAFEVAFDATEGAWQVELLATGPTGPAPLTQVTVHVDEPVPDFHESAWPADQGDLSDPVGRLDRHVRGARIDAGLEPFIRDETLDRIAAAHSAEMQALDYVGHVSPRTGTVGDRLRRADYRASRSGENVALNTSIDDAHAGLMRSIGHRRNLVSPRFTHLGLGAVRGEAGWYVTQVFARPAPDLSDPRPAEEALIRRIAAMRREAGRRPLRIDRALRGAARDEVRSSDPSPRRAVEVAEANGFVGRVSAWTVTLVDPAQLELPAGLRDRELRRLGVAIRRDPDRPLPDVQVVIMAAD